MYTFVVVKIVFKGTRVRIVYRIHIILNCDQVRLQVFPQPDAVDCARIRDNGRFHKNVTIGKRPYF